MLISRLLAVALITLLIGLPALAQDQSDDVIEAPIDMSVETPPDQVAADEMLDETASTEEAPPVVDEQAPEPAQPTAVPAAPPAPPASGIREVLVTLRDDFTLTVSPSLIGAGRVRLVVTNEGRMTHGLGIVGLGLEQFVAPGGTLRQENVMQARAYTLYCPVADHADRGMRAQGQCRHASAW